MWTYLFSASDHCRQHKNLLSHIDFFLFCFFFLLFFWLTANRGGWRTSNKGRLSWQLSRQLLCKKWWFIFFFPQLRSTQRCITPASSLSPTLLHCALWSWPIFRYVTSCGFSRSVMLTFFFFFNWLFFYSCKDGVTVTVTDWGPHLPQQIPGNTSVMQRKWRSMQCSVPSPTLSEPVRVRTSAVCAEIKQIKARRKTARMLMVVLFVFALCYLPISSLNLMKR